MWSCQSKDHTRQAFYFWTQMKSCAKNRKDFLKMRPKLWIWKFLLGETFPKMHLVWDPLHKTRNHFWFKFLSKVQIFFTKWFFRIFFRDFNVVNNQKVQNSFVFTNFFKKNNCCYFFREFEVFNNKIVQNGCYHEFFQQIFFFSLIRSCQQPKSRNQLCVHDFFFKKYFFQFFSWNQSC